MENNRLRLSRSAWRSLALWAAPTVFLVIFFFTPLAAVFSYAFQAAFNSAGTAAIVKAWPPLRFTIWQAALSTILTLLVGIPAAFLFARFSFPGKGPLRVITTLPFILPTVVVAAGINALIGPRGWLNLALMSLLTLDFPPINLLNSLGAILAAHVFYNLSIVIRLVGSAWANLDARQEQAARTLGASPLRAFLEVTLPLLRPSILASALLVFLFDFTSFGVILLLGGPRFSTLEVEIYIQAISMLNLPQAALLSAIQLGATLLLTILYRKLTRGIDLPLAPRLKGEGMMNPSSWRQRAFVGILAGLLFIFMGFPLVSLALRSITRLDADRGERGTIEQGLTLEYYQELFINRRGSLFYIPPFGAIKNSLEYAGITVLISVSLGVVTAYALHQRGRLNQVIDPILMLPLGTSAVTLGLGYGLVFSGQVIDPRTFPMIIPIAHSLVAYPFVVRTIQPSLDAIPGNLRQAAAVLGASPWRVWWEVDRPILTRAVLIGSIFAFTISLGEFGATMFLARPDAPTLPVAIYRFLSQPGAMNYGQAMAIATLLMAVCALGIGWMDRLGEKS